MRERADETSARLDSNPQTGEARTKLLYMGCMLYQLSYWRTQTELVPKVLVHLQLSDVHCKKKYNQSEETKDMTARDHVQIPPLEASNKDCYQTLSLNMTVFKNDITNGSVICSFSFTTLVIILCTHSQHCPLSVSE